MQHRIELVNLEEERPRLERLVERLSARLARGAKALDRHGTLEGVVERHPSRTRFRVFLTLRLPGLRLATQEEGAALEAVVRQAFAEIERRVKRQIRLARTRHLWDRPDLRQAAERLRSTLGSTAPAQHGDRVRQIEPHLARLQEFIRRELTVRQMAGELSRGQLPVTEVVDAVVLEASRRPAPEDMPLDQWLLGLATARIEAEVRRTRAARRRELHIEEDVPETPPEREVSTLGEEIFEFYQPDEDLRLEDLVAAPEPPPTEEAAAAREQLRRWVERALAALPRLWRHAFVLHHMEGLAERDVARALGCSETEVRAALANARAFLEQKLRELGAAGTTAGGGGAEPAHQGGTPA